MDQIKIGKFIANCRKDKNLTQSDLAELLGVSNRTISKWETGRGMCDISMFQPLCEVLGITYNELLNGEKSDIENEQIEQSIRNTIEYTKIQIRNKDRKIQFHYIIIIGITIAFLSSLWDNPKFSYGGISLAFWLMVISCLLPFFTYGYKKQTYLISIISFGLCLISILNIFHLTNQFVLEENIIGILDTLPSMFALSKFGIITTITINLGVFLTIHKRKKST